MDDTRDVGIGAALFSAATRRRGSNPPDFEAVYAAAGLRRTRRLWAVRSGFFLAASMALVFFVPALLKPGLSPDGPDSYRFLISDLSERTVSDSGWDENLFAAGLEAGVTPLGEFLDDLWNL